MPTIEAHLIIHAMLSNHLSIPLLTSSFCMLGPQIRLLWILIQMPRFKSSLGEQRNNDKQSCSYRGLNPLCLVSKARALSDEHLPADMSYSILFGKKNPGTKHMIYS